MSIEDNVKRARVIREKNEQLKAEAERQRLLNSIHKKDLKLSKWL